MGGLIVGVRNISMDLFRHDFDCLSLQQIPLKRKRNMPLQSFLPGTRSNNLESNFMPNKLLQSRPPRRVAASRYGRAQSLERM